MNDLKDELKKDDLKKDRLFFSTLNEIINEKIPFNKLLGINLESIENSIVKIKIKMREELVGNYILKTLHGGVISSVIDVTGGMTALVSIHKKIADQPLKIKREKFSRLGTIDLRVDYLRPGYGDWFISTGYILRAGSKVTVTRIEFHNDKGNLISVGTGSYMVG